ncbi:MAG: LysR family transcriptional regulator [Woeseiaceae bacterium]|nr:LysR family transcriptional regulator [Woeseiaceae bacterium]
MSNFLDRLTLLETFVRIAESGSISSAARDLGLTQPSASRQLAALEDRLKTQLVRRNTHSLALTNAGIELLADARQLLNGWEALAEKHLSPDSELSGSLRIVAPIALGQSHLIRIAGQFLKNHPKVRIAWELNDDDIRFTERGCDCWIRVGQVPDETLIVRELGSVRRLLVASRSLVDMHGLPGTPKKAERYPLVALSPYEGGKISVLRGQRVASCTPQVVLETNNIFALKESVLAGIGMAIVPEWFVVEELGNGQLLDILPGWEAPRLRISAAYSPGRHRPQRLNVFLKHIADGVLGMKGIEAP